MATDWSAIENNMIAAVKSVLSGAWPTVANGATSSLKALSIIAQEVENCQDMNADEKKELMSNYEDAIEDTLTAYESISAAVAQNAVAAAVKVLISAVPSIAGFA